MFTTLTVLQRRQHEQNQNAILRLFYFGIVHPLLTMIRIIGKNNN